MMFGVLGKWERRWDVKDYKAHISFMVCLEFKRCKLYSLSDCITQVRLWQSFVLFILAYLTLAANLCDR